MEPGLAGADRLASDDNFRLGAEFSAVMKLGGNSLSERIRLLRANYPRAGWDVNLLDLNTQVQDSNIFSSEMKGCFQVATDMILKHLNEFLNSAKRYKYLKYPLRYSGDCRCAVSMENVEKYIITLADGAPSKEPKFSASRGSLTAHLGGTDLSFLYGFMSTAIYLIHKCSETGSFRANLLTSFNKLSPPNLGVLEVELLAQTQSVTRAKYFAGLFKVPFEKILCFCDNQSCLYLIKNFAKNFLQYKPFYLKHCKSLVDSKIPVENFWYIPSKANIIDIATRPSSMQVENLELFLGDWDPKKLTFQRNSQFFGNFTAEKFIFGNSLPDDNSSTLEGMYHMSFDPEFANSEEVKKALVAGMSLPPTKRAIGGSHPIANNISNFATLGKLKKHDREECCKSQVVTRDGKFITSVCMQKLWTQWERDNVDVEFCCYMLSRFGSLEKIVRVLYIILTFLYKLKRKVQRCSLSRAENKTLLQNRLLVSYEEFTCAYGDSKMQQQILPFTTESETQVPIIRKQEFDVGLLILTRHMQHFIHPELILELSSHKFTSELPGFRNLIIYLDEHNLVRVHNAASVACTQVNYEYLIKNKSRSKILAPSNKQNKIFAIKLNMFYHIKNNCCQLRYLLQIASGIFYHRSHKRYASSAINLCHVCLYRRLIRQKKFVSPPIFTFPKKFELSTNINTLSAQLNSDWELDFIPALKIKHDACIFVTPSDKVKFQDVCKSPIYTNLLLFSNLRTGYVHFQLLPSRKYRDIRMSLQSFLHTYAIHKVKFHCDSESAFLKGECVS